MDALSSLSLFLVRIGNLSKDNFIEVRYSTRTGMGQAFFPGNKMHQATRTIRGLARRTDVYIGAAPRIREAGNRDAVKWVPMAWVDCDSQESTELLRDFTAEWAAPTFVINSGTPGHVHAWWLLDKPVGPRAAEIANRRIAHALGGDLRACDRARILRPPATFNHKTDPALPVRLIEYRPNAIYNLGDLVRKLDDPPEPEPRRKPTEPRERRHPEDPLLDIPATEYAPILTGEEPNARSKITCPFHEDGDASLHLYDDPDKGWHCFGCGKGGTVYDFAGFLWELDTRGNGFKQLKRRLTRELRRTPA